MTTKKPTEKTTTTRAAKGSPGRAGNKVIVRTRDAGVHFGTVVSYDPVSQVIVLQDARRCFRWQIDYRRHGTSQVTCSELAMFGPHGDSRMGVRVLEQELLGVIEVLSTTALAAAAIEGWPT